MKKDDWTTLLKMPNDAPLASAEWIAPLPQYELIKVGGEDAASFLQAQLTRDILHGPKDRSYLSAWCNAKGRVLAVLRVIPESDGFLLRLPKALSERIIARLKMFVLRSKVSLQEVGGDRVHVGLAGPRTARALAECCGALPTGDGEIARDDDALVIRAPGDSPRFEVITRARRVAVIAQTLSQHASLARPGAWQIYDIKAGIPEVWTETYEQFIPQSLNLDLLDGVSLRKGCYPGQEIVARTHYLGKAKRRMYVARTSAPLPSPGDKLYAPTSEQAVGRIVSAAQADDTVWLLAVSSVAPDEAVLHVTSKDGAVISPATLPYALDAVPAS